MTGEMSESEVTRDRFPALFKLKDEINRRFDVDVEARPHDQYQGAYLRIDRKIKVWMDSSEGGWKTGSLENSWYFEGVEYEDTIHGGSGVYQMLEAEGYERKDQEPSNKDEKISDAYDMGYKEAEGVAQDSPETDASEIVHQARDGFTQSASWANNYLPRFREMAGFEDSGPGTYTQESTAGKQEFLDALIDAFWRGFRNRVEQEV